EKTVDGSGLNANGQHSTTEAEMWLGDAPNGEPVWIQYDFDRVYKLYDVHVWNYNSTFESLLGFGAKDVTIEYATEPNEWAVLGDFEVAKAPGAPYAGVVIDLGGLAARSIRIKINSNWGSQAKFGLSEVRFSYVPVYAREPKPAAGATRVDPSVVLNWRAGREADLHRVYFGTDEEAVAAGTVLVDALADNSFDPGSLNFGQTYYWRIDEVNEAAMPSLWQGDVWDFATQEYLPVDDFEGYTDDDGNRLFDFWLDGYEITTNGSVVGYEDRPYAERTITHSGGQSMPFSYDNTGTATYSEATRTFDEPQDWTRNGIGRLALYFYGYPDNAITQRLYARINGAKVVYTGDAADIAAPVWTPWNIDLASLGVDLKRVTQVTIGFERNGGAGGSGKVLIDDVRLYPPLPAPSQPEPFAGAWAYTYTGDAAVAGAGYTALDGTWSHDNGSDEWDGSTIGQGRPGGASSLNGYLRIQDPGDPRDYSLADPGSNRKIAFAHSITSDIAGAAARILDGVTILFRARVATGTPLDGLYPAGGAGTTPWPAGGDGYVTHDAGKGNFNIRQSEGDEIVSFSLALASDSDFLQGKSGLVMNSRNGTEPSGSVDVYESEGKLNILELDPTAWHDYWITIQPDVTGSGTHLVRVYLDGALVANDFIVTAGNGNDYDDSYVLIGAGATPQSGAFDVDYFSYQQGVFAPVGQP
ncbi:MAG: hypothetical protein JW741_26660, partial [Sedimentisphaerales bacterium]|nr:hypothetical protein [Sedimentisphaerales bacterium]